VVAFSSPISSESTAGPGTVDSEGIVTGNIMDVEVIIPMVEVLPGAVGVTRSRWPCPMLVALLLLFCVGVGPGGRVDEGGGEGADGGGVLLGVPWGSVGDGVLCCCW
jgi:hypothetical protein